MKTLYKVLESLLGTDFEDQLDSKVLGELSNFIDVLKKTKLDRYDSETYNSQDQKLCDAAERVGRSNAFERITRPVAIRMLDNRKPGTLLVVNWGLGTYEWKLVDTAAAEFIRIGCIPSGESQYGPHTNIQIHSIRSGHEDKAMGHNRNHKLYAFPVGTYEYFKNAITK